MRPATIGALGVTTLAAIGSVFGPCEVRGTDPAGGNPPTLHCTDEVDPHTGACAPPSLATRIDAYCIAQKLERDQFEACQKFWLILGRVPDGR